MLFFEFITSTVLMAKGSSTLPSTTSQAPIDTNFEEVTLGRAPLKMFPQVVATTTTKTLLPVKKHSSPRKLPLYPDPDETNNDKPVTNDNTTTNDHTTISKDESANPDPDEVGDLPPLASSVDLGDDYRARHSRSLLGLLIRLNRLLIGGASFNFDPQAGSPKLLPRTPMQASPRTRTALIAGTSLVDEVTSDASDITVPMVERTPLTMTPLARLKLRRLQIADSISKSQRRLAAMAPPVADDDDDDDDLIDDQVPVYHVPLSQPLTLIKNGEKFTFGNAERNNLLANSLALLRSSLLILGDSDHRLGGFSPETTTTSINTGANEFSFEVNKMSKEAQRLTLMFSSNEINQILEESRQRRLMLTNCKRLSIMPKPQPVMKSAHHLMLEEEISVAQLPRISKQEPNPRQLVYISENTANPATPPLVAQVKQLLTELSQFFSYTRPTWLPPKLEKDKHKHQKQLEHLIYQALMKESQEHSKKIQRLEKAERLRKKDSERWRNLLDLPVSQYKLEATVDDMVWRGIDAGIRAKAWWKEHMAQALGGTTYDQEFCDHYFELYDRHIMPNLQLLDDLLSEVYRIKTALDLFANNSTAELKGSLTLARLRDQDAMASEKISRFEQTQVTSLGVKLSEVKSIYDRIMTDLLDTYPDLNFFQGYDVMQKLARVVISFVLHLHDTEASGGRLEDYYFAETVNLVAIFFYQFRNLYKALAQMCQLYTRRLPQLMLSYQVAQRQVEHAKITGDLERERACKLSLSVINNSLQNYFLDKFELSLNRNNNRSYTHFKVVGLKQMDYLPELVLGLFANKVNFELSCHILDIFLFGEDEVMIKLILGLFQLINYKLFGNKEEIVRLLSSGGNERSGDSQMHRYFNVGYQHEFIDKVRTIKVC